MSSTKEKIYFYSTPAQYEDQIELGRLPMLKIGRTKQEDAKVRIEQQDTTSNPEALVCKGVYEVDDGTDDEFRDEWLSPRGFKATRTDKRREWMYITAEDAEFELSEWQKSKNAKADKVAEERTLKKHQGDFVSKVLSNWQQWKEYLLFAKCRAGKSTMVLSAIVESGAKVSLIMSYRNSPKQSWGEDISKFKNFQNLIFIDIRDKDIKEVSSDIQKYLNTERQIVLYSTVQSKHRWSKLSCDIDLIVFDECHEGYRGETWKTLCKKFPDSKILYVSGTAYKMFDEFSDSSRYTYTYFDEQFYKLQGVSGYENSPRMNLIIFKYLADKLQEVYGDDPDAFDNIFRLNKSKDQFNEPILVDEFYSKIFVQDGVHFKKKLLKDTQHMMLRLPSIEACHLFAKYFRSSRFAPLVVTSDTNENSTTIKKHIGSYESTVIITVDANVLGLTAEKIDTVMNCAGGESREKWVQFAYRGGSTNKEKWNVIDFCPERCLKETRDSFFTSCDLNPAIAESNYSLLDFASIVEYIDEHKEVDQERLNEILASNLRSTMSLASGICSRIDADKLNELYFSEYQQSSDPSSFTGTASGTTVNSNGMNGKSNVRRTTSGKFSTQFPKEELDQKMETTLAYTERMCLVIFHMVRDGFVPKTVSQILNSEHYVPDTSDKDGIIKKCLDQEIIPKSWNKRVEQCIIDVQHAVSKDECVALEDLSITRKNQLPLPINELMRIIPEPKSGKEKLCIDCDPTGLHSLVAIKKKGWSPENIWVWETDDTHTYAIRQISDRINISTHQDVNKMHFTATIGNPPYTDTSTVTGATTGGCAKTLDTEFYLNAMKRSDYVSEVIRSNHFAKISSKFRRTLFSTPGVVSIKSLSNDTFPSIQLTETCIVTWRRGYTGPTRFEYLDGTVKEIVVTKDTCVRFTNPDFVSEVSNNLAHRYQRGSLNVNQLIDGDYPMIITMGPKGGSGMIVRNVREDQHICCVNQHGVVMNSKYGGKGLGQVYVKPYGHSISGSAIILKTNSEEESQKLAEYLRTPEVHNIVVKNRISNANTKEMFKTIPDII